MEYRFYAICENQFTRLPSICKVHESHRYVWTHHEFIYIFGGD